MRKQDHRLAQLEMLLLALFFAAGTASLVTSCKSAAEMVAPVGVPSPCPESFWRELEMAESGGNPRTMYREDGIPYADKVTGLPVIFSEGPFQMSYSDYLWYGEDCNFQYERDRDKFYRDIDGHMTGPASFRAKYADRVILTYAASRKCAERVLYHQLAKGTLRKQSYWSVIRANRVRVPASCGAYLER